MDEQTPPSPLGRYDEADDDARMHDVRLLNLPVRLLAAGRQHHDELMHEFSVLAVSGDDERSGLPRRLLELIEILGVRYAGAAERPDAAVDAALARGEDTIDLTYQVGAHIVDAADKLAALLAEADDFCRAERMLTLARGDLIIEFSTWYLEEFRRQVAGEPPRPWTGPLAP